MSSSQPRRVTASAFCTPSLSSVGAVAAVSTLVSIRVFQLLRAGDIAILRPDFRHDSRLRCRTKTRVNAIRWCGFAASFFRCSGDCLLKNGLAAVLDSAVSLLQRHPKRLTAALAAVLLCGGGGAFAVASLGPDMADMPVRQLTQSVTPLELQAQVDALDLHRFNLYRTETSRSSDTARSLLDRLGIADSAAGAYLGPDALVRQNLLGRAGRLVTAEAADDHSLQRLSMRWITSADATEFQRLVVERTADGFSSRVEKA